MARNTSKAISGMTGDHLGTWNPDTKIVVDIQGRTARADTYLEALDVMRGWCWVVLYQMP